MSQLLSRKAERQLKNGVVYVARWNAISGGVTDNTAILTAVHTYANSIGAQVSYAGIEKIAVQANAQIQIKTSVDFAGCELVILGGVVGSPSFSTFNTVFVVSDDDCPLVTTTGAVSSTNLTKGALFPTLGLFDGHGFARLECSYQVPNRNKDGTVNYQQSFKVNRNGRCSQPLSVDLTAHAAAITVRYRKTSKKRLRIEGPAVTEGSWNNQRIFHIKRCNVEINGMSVLFNEPGTAFDNVCELVSVEDASDVWVNGFVTTGRQVTATIGSYCLAINGGADIFVNGMNALTGWGATGCNYISGIYFEKCVLNRVDAHQSGHNVFVNDCDLHEAGMVYGWGGGVLSVKNSRLHRCAAISNRPDYGNTFFGDLVVSDCEAENNFTSTYRLVDLETNPLGASTPVYAPTSITVNNVKRVGRASGSNAEFIPVAIKVRGATDVVYSPTNIGVSGIDCFPSWRFGLRVDTMNMEANPSHPICRIVFDNVRPDTTATSATGVLDFSAIRTPTTRVRPWIRGADSENIYIQNMAPANLEIDLANVSINGVLVDKAAAAQPTVTLTNCKLKNPAYTNAPVGGGSSSSNGYTTLSGCEIAAVQFDLSLISAAIGTTVRNGALSPTLPAGVTVSDLFTGWRKPGAFA